MKIIVNWFRRRNLGGFICMNCGKRIENGVYIHPDNKTKTPMKSFCQDCYTYEIGRVEDKLKELYHLDEIEIETVHEEDKKGKKK